jgi:hypothetical protein
LALFGQLFCLGNLAIHPKIQWLVGNYDAAGQNDFPDLPSDSSDEWRLGWDATPDSA